MSGIRFSQEELEWIFSQPAELTYKQLTELFSKKFRPVSQYAMSDLRKRHPDRMPSRKSNIEKTRYRVGPKAKYKIGDEIIKAGYVYVKVADHYIPGKTTNEDYKRNWKRKAEVVWEKEHGAIPEGMFLVFLDKNPLNTDISNLYLVNRKIHARMANLKGYNSNPVITECGLKLCELIDEITHR